MLGSLKCWNWAVSGKHPVAGDYFQIGSDSPMLTALSDWVKKGYQLLISENKYPPDRHSWRFWIKGQKKGHLVCGVVRDSSDNIGRPYPLLIVGEGRLDKWSDYWELLPAVLDKTWNHMEHLSTKRFIDFKQLEDDVPFIINPVPQWPDASAFVQGKFNSEPNDLHKSMKFKIRDLEKNGEFLAPIRIGTLFDPVSVAVEWNLLIRKKTKNIPNFVLMGGIPEKVFLAVFNRPLVSRDFVRLWSV